MSPPPVTETVFAVLTAVAETDATSVMASNAPPAARALLRRQVTVDPAITHDQPGPVAVVGVRPAGSVSVTTTSPVVDAPPTFLTTIENETVPPWTTVPGACDLERVKSGAASGTPCVTVTASLAVLLPGVTSLPPETVTVLVSLEAVADTLTLTTMAGYDCPAGKLSERVHVTDWAFAAHVQSTPAAVPVKPAGNVSTTLTGPDVGPFPWFETVIVKVPVCPCVNVSGACVLVMVRSGVTAPPTGVTIVAVLFPGTVSPPPATIAVFVRLSGALAGMVASIEIGGKLAPGATAVVRVQVTT